MGRGEKDYCDEWCLYICTIIVMNDAYFYHHVNVEKVDKIFFHGINKIFKKMKSSFLS